MKRARTSACPCGSGRELAACCGPLLDGSRQAASAGELMRSRYSAYVLRDAAWLAASWHPSTRPAQLDFSDPHTTPTWLGLDVRREEQADADHASVEFVARFRLGGGSAQRMHEISRFVREAGRWYYLGGQVDPG